MNGKQICCAIDRKALESLNLVNGDRDLISLFKQNWSKIRDVAYFKIQMGSGKQDENGRVELRTVDFEDK